MFESVLRNCPYCGETVEVAIDEGGSSTQSYVEDCSVCCRPIRVLAERLDAETDYAVQAFRD